MADPVVWRSVFGETLEVGELRLEARCELAEFRQYCGETYDSGARTWKEHRVVCLGEAAWGPGERPWPEGYDPVTGRPLTEKQLRVVREEERKRRLMAGGLPGGLPDMASIGEELRWLAANAHCVAPDFTQAPSISAVNQWRDISSSVRLREKFWDMLWRSRQPELRKVVKESPVLEDAGGDGGLDEELSKRLFGGG